MKKDSIKINLIAISLASMLVMSSATRLSEGVTTYGVVELVFWSAFAIIDALIANAKYNELNKGLYMENGRRYKKSSYDTNILMKNLDKALDNLEYYETDIERIKNRVGSSIYGLLKEIIE